MDSIMSVDPAPESPGRGIEPQSRTEIPPLRWIMVGYFFWVGIFLGALIMRAATGY
jgi:hypothetical protein